ncbi:MAG: 23S rRNA (pseudouridine(1915)-N(3))-methyltransferase RlmH [Minisyncoccia bacterium]
MKITLLTIGEPRQSFIKEGVAEYIKRLGGFTDFTHTAIKEKDIVASIQKHTKRAKLILLDEKGTEYTSAGFAKFLEKNEQQSTDLVFVIGGADGHTKETRALSHDSMSLSQLTLPHEFALLFFVETLYRALTIKSGHPYHRGN